MTKQNFPEKCDFYCSPPVFVQLEPWVLNQDQCQKCQKIYDFQVFFLDTDKTQQTRNRHKTGHTSEYLRDVLLIGMFTATLLTEQTEQRACCEQY